MRYFYWKIAKIAQSPDPQWPPEVGRSAPPDPRQPPPLRIPFCTTDATLSGPSASNRRFFSNVRVYVEYLGGGNLQFLPTFSLFSTLGLVVWSWAASKWRSLFLIFWHPFFTQKEQNEEFLANARKKERKKTRKKERKKESRFFYYQKFPKILEDAIKYLQEYCTLPDDRHFCFFL